MCQKADGHFDSASFFLGIFLVFMVSVAWFSLSATNKTIKKESKLPETCQDGQQILMTTAPAAEFYVCESHWVRR